MPEATNIVTPADRRDHERGRQVGAQSWRNFCCDCFKPLTVHTPELSEKKDIECVDCRPRLSVRCARGW